MDTSAAPIHARLAKLLLGSWLPALAVLQLAALVTDGGGGPTHTDVATAAPVVKAGARRTGEATTTTTVPATTVPPTTVTPTTLPATTVPPPPPPEPEPAPPPPPPPPAAPADVQTLLEHHNARRAELGVAPLQRMGCLDDIARAWAGHLAARGSLAHQSDLGAKVDQCFWWSAIGENVGYVGSAADLAAAFWNSPHHRQNIASGSYR